MTFVARCVSAGTVCRRAVPGILLLVSVLLSAVGGGCKRTYGRQACRLERENVIAVGSGEASAVDLTALRAGGFALGWSIGKTTRLVVLDPALRVKAGPFEIVKNRPVVPLGDMGDSGAKMFWHPDQGAPIAAADIALTELPGGGVAVAAVESESSIRGGGAFVMKITPEGSGGVVVKRLGGAGPHAATVSAAVNDKTLAVAWHEGLKETSRIRTAVLSTDNLAVSKESVVEARGAVFHPHLLAYEDGFLLAHVQVLETRRDAKADVVLTRLDEKAQPRGESVLARSRFLAAEPRLVLGAEGPALVYRDDEEGDGRAEYFFLPLDAGLEARGLAARISRSDGYQGPRVAKKDGMFVAATVRSFQNNLLVGLNRFDGEGRKKGGEFQVYADSASFVRVDLVQQASQTLLAYLEEDETRCRVLVSEVTCEERVNP